MESSWRALLPLAGVVTLALARGPAVAQERRGSNPPGQAAYDRVCHSCHGPEGRGDGAPRLVPFDRSYEELLAIVRDGRGQMPPISERRLTDEEVTLIIEYLKALSDRGC
jgi:mono/diheme cytochrome c family protein